MFHQSIRKATMSWAAMKQAEHRAEILTKSRLAKIRAGGHYSTRELAYRVYAAHYEKDAAGRYPQHAVRTYEHHLTEMERETVAQVKATKLALKDARENEYAMPNMRMFYDEFDSERWFQIMCTLVVCPECGRQDYEGEMVAPGMCRECMYGN